MTISSRDHDPAARSPIDDGELQQLCERLERFARGEDDFLGWDDVRAAVVTLRAQAAELKALGAGLELIRDQPDTHPRVGGRWIDWAKARARKALSGTK